MSSYGVCLRELEPADQDSVWRLLSNFDVIRYMLFPLYTREMAAGFVRRARASGTLSPVRAIQAAPAGPVAGLCGLVICREREDAEAWYLLDPAAWRRGYATQALRLLLEMGFKELGLHRIYACSVPENVGSVCVLEKCGMRREGHLVRNLRIQGDWRDSLLYAILREEWQASREE